MLDAVLFIGVPYLALVILIVGVLAKIGAWISPRGLTSLASVAVVSYNWSAGARAGEVLKRILTFYTLKYTNDKLLYWGALLFHWGIFLTLFLGHTALFFSPEQLAAMGIDPATRKIIAIGLGTLFGIVVIIGLILLWARRLTKPEVKSFTFADDWFALVLITAIVLVGLVNTAVIHPHYDKTVTPWLQNLLTGNVAAALEAITKAEPLVKLHIFLAEVLMIYVPFGKMIHPFTIFFEPTITSPPYKVSGSEVILK
ncbi:respiratory nitrate reductase gamma subunit [Pyrobaculum islandicum DSM 4184]|uniref:Respiratory nitrate reductase gamma subunit n=1 Tax=Pyrobaculum islandicum (strain DSM 4184 / JCM 9189 / GEO3) TaxID=384616 RepID=A1RQX2_PYRIL|nr:respiratory nitrate reductase subunit gamma [Pyrobaculum islandicum]ABL87354.1 respiratory nitrate reductase gamma subunit [Pyrobaculum islandicum DSM 4184]